MRWGEMGLSFLAPTAAPLLRTMEAEGRLDWRVRTDFECMRARLEASMILRMDGLARPRQEMRNPPHSL